MKRDYEEKILLIDDEVDTVKLMATYLKREGFKVYQANNGREALFLLEEIVPDLIICDVMMPHMDGFEFRNAIWQDPDLQLIPFIFMTALGSIENRKKGYELFADDYLVKPFDFDELTTRIRAKLEKYRLVQKMLRYDTLTKVYSRRFLSSLLSIEIERCKRHSRELSIAMIDLDNFKQINDSHGHIIGDEVLYRVAQFFSQNIREYDSICRYGGEEFIIVMPEISKEAAKQVLSRLQLELSEMEMTEFDVRITCSAGISGFPEDGGDLKTLIYNADKGLHRAKKLGKNRVELYQV